MLPGDIPSALALPGLFLPPDDQVVSPLHDYEAGGPEVGSSENGLTGYRWQCWVVGTDVMLQRDGAAAVLLLQQSGITDLSFAFDQSMRPTVVYRLTSGVIYLRWYDTTVNGYLTDNLGVGRNPRLSLDDKRSISAQTSDIILAYITGGNLIYRQQRDRFTIPRTLKSGIADDVQLRNIGMSTNLRMQFELV